MPPMPAEAEAPPDLVTPLTAIAARSAVAASASSSMTLGIASSSRSRSGRSRASHCGSASPGKPVLRCGARHRDDALGDRVDGSVAVGGEIVGRYHRLAAADEGAQADIVAFGALRGFDAAVAYVDRLGDAAHRDGIRRIGTVTAGGLDQPLGYLCEARLIEERGHGGTPGGR